MPDPSCLHNGLYEDLYFTSFASSNLEPIGGSMLNFSAFFSQVAAPPPPLPPPHLPPCPPPPSPSAAYRSKAHPRAHTHTIYGLLAGAGSFPR